MTLTRTRSEIGKSNRRKGADAERAVVTYLRDHGWPGAERAVRTAYRTANRTLDDPGDITGTPLLVWQVKDHAREHITEWLAETEDQRAAVRAGYGILVVRRRGTADPGRWWVWLTGEDLAGLFSCDDESLVPGTVLQAAFRTELDTVVRLLRAHGFGGMA